MKVTATLIASLFAYHVAGHAAIISATGDAGGTGMALGVDTATPRDGTRRAPFQQDSTRFKGNSAATVGETLAGGDNDVEAGTTAIMGETGDALPQVTPGGEVQMTLHQVNGDGAGPYSCAINDDATAATWTDSKSNDCEHTFDDGRALLTWSFSPSPQSRSLPCPQARTLATGKPLPLISLWPPPCPPTRLAPVLLLARTTSASSAAW